MILNTHQLETAAREFALTNELAAPHLATRRFWPAFRSDMASLRSFAERLSRTRVECTQPAEDWLLDHIAFIESQFEEVLRQLPRTTLRQLPRLKQSGIPRVYALCDDYLTHTDGRYNVESFERYVLAYEQVAVLKTTECWILPNAMRVTLIRRLAQAMQEVRYRHEVCGNVSALLEQVEKSNRKDSRIRALLEAQTRERRLGTAEVVHLVQHLTEWEPDIHMVRDWLAAHIENSETSLENMVSYEHQLQSQLQVTCGNLVQSLHVLERFPWRLTFRKISHVESILSAHEATEYDLLDISSQDLLLHKVTDIARQLKVPETLIASTAARLAEERFRLDRNAKSVAQHEIAQNEVAQNEVISRDGCLAYFLVDAKGTTDLRKALSETARPRRLPGLAPRQRPLSSYLTGGVVLYAVLFAAAAVWALAGREVRFWPFVAALLLLLLPVSDWAISMLHGAIVRCCRPASLLRYDFSRALPESARTMVVIPIIWSSVAEVDDVLDRLLVHYYANRQDNIHFAVLADFPDAAHQDEPGDEAILQHAVLGVEALQEKFGRDRFFLFHRRRDYNPVDKVYMGWERKRGKLVEFVELLSGKDDTSFTTVCGNSEILQKVRYVFTADHDTKLPMGVVSRMAATMHYPFNRPRLNAQGTRVTEGFGVLQPRITMSFESSMRSRFAALWAGEPGIDPYAFAVSTPYQDLFGKSVFVGKGIFDVAAFLQTLVHRIPDNQVLSHDILEGGFLRTGLTSDIEVVEDQPSTMYAGQIRAHRWIRGDWQLLRWLGRTCKDRNGDGQPIDLCGLTRWHIIDNLRRSLLSPAILLLLLFGEWALPGRSFVYETIAATTLFLPTISAAVSAIFGRGSFRALGVSFLQSCFRLLTLPFTVAMAVDAVVRTLYRMFVSKKRLLEWVPAAKADKGFREQRVFVRELSGYAVTALFAVLSLVSDTVFGRVMGILALIAWGICARLVVVWMNGERHTPRLKWLDKERGMLEQLTTQIWGFYERYVTAKESWLPPDNVQFHPKETVAHRTSPTNIGLYLASVVAACDLGLIDAPTMVRRLQSSMRTVWNLEKWYGHLFNWYDTLTAKPLSPRYVSTVDSGNLVAYLLVTSQGLLEWAERIEKQRGDADVKDYDDMTRNTDSLATDSGITESGSTHSGSTDSGTRGKMAVSRETLLGDIRQLLDDIEQFVLQTDYTALFNPDERVFCLGYHVDANRRETVLYDLLASESRQASFVAIALGQVPVSHWFALGRTMTLAGGHKTLLSWSGTMFEYLMPSLIMKTYPKTIWDSTYQGVVARQQAYAALHRVPFGISESGYYAFDYHMNYQYRAFGVPGLGFDRGLEQHLVIAPYATTMALPYAGESGLRALRQFEELGANGEYGLYEAVDFTSTRLPAGCRHKIIESFMAHHQGMSLLALTNLLTDNLMVRRFHADYRVRAAELLLQERLPAKAALIRQPIGLHAKIPDFSEQVDDALQTFRPGSSVVHVNVLSNGQLTSVQTTDGNGFLSWNGMMVTRWQEDPVTDSSGAILYIHDPEGEKTWAATDFPYRSPQDATGVFSLDKSTYVSTNDHITTKLDITISGELDAEVRRLKLSNDCDRVRTIEVTSFLELALATQAADSAHKAFVKLFVETSHDDSASCLLAKRRPHEEKDTETWAVHTLFVDGPQLGDYEYETDRAAFIGRGGTLREPRAMAAHLKGSVGSVTDPAFIMRRTVRLSPGESATVYMITGVAKSREEAVSIIEGLCEPGQADRAFHLAWVRAQIDLRHFHLSPKQARSANELAARLLYPLALSELRRKAILGNSLGQSALWSLSLSGDAPIVTVAVMHKADLPFVIGLAKQHQYLCRLGLQIDLVVLDETENGYQDELMNQLRDALAGRGIGDLKRIVAHKRQDLGEDELKLLKAASRVWLRAGGPSLHAQLQVDEGRLPRVAAGAVGGVQVTHHPLHPDVRTSHSNAAEFYNGFGGFVNDGKAYEIDVTPGGHLPKPWSNVLANPHFGTLLTELGTGYTWWRNSRECKLTPWTNDPVIDRPGECLYLRDIETNELWSGAPKPAGGAHTFQVTHGFGFSRFEQLDGEVVHVMETTVPIDDPLKLIRLTLTNRSGGRKRIAVTYYAEWVLGVIQSSESPYIVTQWDAASRTMMARNTHQETFRDAVGFLHIATEEKRDESETLLTGRMPNVSWTADRTEFLGRAGNIESPAALWDESLSRQTGVFANTCGAIQTIVELPANGESTLTILFGCTDSTVHAKELVDRYGHPGAYQEALAEVQEQWERITGVVQVQTPSRAMDLLQNGWLLYQALGCRLWARTAFYQAGGAFGFRDQLQDALALLYADPDILRSQILLCARHQYQEGDVQHWWHEETGKGIRTRISDDLLWLPYAVSRYVEHTGDNRLLQETVPFLHSHPLQPDELERYEDTVVSKEQGTTLDHCLRAIRHACKFGEHKIPLMGTGDWNDGMNRIGAEGRGESVWLGWFLLDVLKRFDRLAKALEVTPVRSHGTAIPDEVVREFHEIASGLERALNENAWDGAWFRRAYTDSQTWLGSIADKECRIDAIAQSWSVISEGTTVDRQARAMRSFERELVDRDLGLARLLTRAFDETKPSPGYIQGYPPGIRENGGQYTHGVIWSIVAWALLGRKDKAFDLFALLNPISHTETAKEVMAFGNEPYVMSADVYTADPHQGEAGWSWYTGSAGWMYQAGLEYVLGVKKRQDRLYVEPCVPQDWEQFRVHYRFGSTMYHIEVECSATLMPPEGVEGSSREGSTYIKDGEVLAEPYLHLVDDGTDHQVRIVAPSRSIDSVGEQLFGEISDAAR